jgi:SAM-dependent methyltransferase
MVHSDDQQQHALAPPPDHSHLDHQPPEIDVDSFENDSGLGDEDDYGSETTSLSSTLLKGHIENGRKYASLRDDYWGPSDERQFETMDAGHAVYILLEADTEDPHKNILFRSPIAEPTRILDVGTGPGTWAIDVADKFPDCEVHGIDLFPPPVLYAPTNCILEVDDASKPWTFSKPFDLIHLRLLLGAFTDEGWATLYRQAYENLKPGGWIEQLELDVRVMSDDGSLPPDSLLAGWGPTFLGCGERAGRSLATQTTMRSKIEAAGFTNVQDKLYKVPIGRWPRDKLLKQTGRVNFEHWSAGLEGWAMFLLTKFGEPPYSADEVRVYVAAVRNELQNPALHIWHYTRRVWAQKPY